jgi:hypothetical protein
MSTSSELIGESVPDVRIKESGLKPINFLNINSGLQHFIANVFTFDFFWPPPSSFSKSLR